MNKKRLIAALAFGACLVVQPSHAQSAPIIDQGVRDRVAANERVRVIVELHMPGGMQAEGHLSWAQTQQQRDDIAMYRERLFSKLSSGSYTVVHEYESVPYVALEIDATALAELEAATFEVVRVAQDNLLAPSLVESVPQIEGDVAAQMGLDGSGTVIAIIDSGIDAAHPFLAGKVVEEACYSTGENQSPGDCPNGQATQIGPGSGAPCDFAPQTCGHGTHVAGIAVGSDSQFAGVAPGASLMALQVFHASVLCFPTEEFPCARAFGSDIGAALERVYALRTQYNVAAVNMSLGGGLYEQSCDLEDPQIAALIANLRSVDIATIVASGNNAVSNAIGFPACVSSAISVGATTDTDEVAWFSNVSADLDVFAPGIPILSSLPNNKFGELGGTSMAAPHVSGAWAILRQANPSASVDVLLGSLVSTGVPVTDERGALPITKPRVRLGGALGVQSPTPVIDSIAPSAAVAWGPGVTLTVTGSGFVRASVVQINGVSRGTTYVSDTELAASVPPGDVATTVSSLTVSVFTPPPGGGTSNTTALTITPPSLAVSTNSAGTGETVTVTVLNPPGDPQDWLALARVGDPDANYHEWSYVDPTTPTWAVAMPDTPGDYEFRLYLNNGFQLISTSETVTVSSVADPSPPTLSIDAATATPGSAVTVTLTDGEGGASDWLALASVGSPAGAYIDWTYVGVGVTDTTWTVTMPSTTGDYEFRLFLNGGFTINTTSPTVAVEEAAPPQPNPMLTVNTTSAAPGDPVTVTLSNGPGGAQDWLALASVASPDGSYVDFTNLGPGITDTSWTVNMPATPGDYEFRLHLDGSSVRAATSPTITVQDSPPPDPSSPELTVSANSATTGEAMTVTLTGGLGGAQDWLAFASVSHPDGNYLDWTYIGAGVTDTTWTITMPATPGDYEFRLFLNGGYTRAATSPTVSVGEPVPQPDPPSLAVSATTVQPGDPVTVTLTNGLGGAQDWVALAGVDDPDTLYIDSVTIGAGVTSTAWTVNMPSTPGDYEFRLFPDGGFTRAATSPTVTVDALPPDPAGPELTVSTVTAGPGETVTVTLTGAPGGVADWLALATVGDPNYSYWNYTYVSAGSSSWTWTVSLPAAPGAYEFRFFLNNDYHLEATSPAVLVQ